jgi:hypothetical protein
MSCLISFPSGLYPNSSAWTNGIEFLEILRKVNPSLPKEEIERLIVKYKS